MRECDVMFIPSFCKYVKCFEILKWRTHRQSQNRQYSNSFFVFVKKEIVLLMKTIQFANILLTGNCNNTVFTLFPIMNKMRVILPMLYNRKPFVTYIYPFFGNVCFSRR